MQTFKRTAALVIALLVFAMAMPAALADEKDDVVQAVRDTGIPEVFIQKGINVLKSYDITPQMRDAMLESAAKAKAVLGTRTIYDLNQSETSQILSYAQATLSALGLRVNVQPGSTGGLRFSLIRSSDGAVVEVLDTRDAGGGKYPSGVSSATVQGGDIVPIPKTGLSQVYFIAALAALALAFLAFVPLALRRAGKKL